MKPAIKKRAPAQVKPVALAFFVALASTLTAYGLDTTVDKVCKASFHALTGELPGTATSLAPASSAGPLASTLGEALSAKGIVRGAHLAAGGMGTVSGGTARRTDGSSADVVIKEPLGSGAARDRNSAALRREWEAWRKLNPNGYVELVEAADGSVALVVDRVKGPSLEKLLTQDERFSENAAKRDGKFIDMVATALVQSMVPLEKAKLVHGDISPKNVHVDIQGNVVAARLIDFGLTKPAQTEGNHTISGSPGYFGVEASTGKIHTEARDVYAMQQTLLRLYYRDFYDRIEDPSATNTTRRGYAGFYKMQDMHKTMESGEYGVKPEIAWVLRSGAIVRTQDFKLLLEKAQQSKDMDTFLNDLVPTFVETWKGADADLRETMMVDLARAPKYRTAFTAKLPPEIQKQIVSLLKEHEDKKSLVMKPYGTYTDVVPMLGEFRKEFERSQLSGLARVFSRLRFR